MDDHEFSLYLFGIWFSSDFCQILMNACVTFVFYVFKNLLPSTASTLLQVYAETRYLLYKMKEECFCHNKNSFLLSWGCLGFDQFYLFDKSVKHYLTCACTVSAIFPLSAYCRYLIWNGGMKETVCECIEKCIMINKKSK